MAKMLFVAIRPVGEVYWQLLSAMDSGVLWHGYEERPTIAVRA